MKDKTQKYEVWSERKEKDGTSVEYLELVRTNRSVAESDKLLLRSITGRRCWVTEVGTCG